MTRVNLSAAQKKRLGVSEATTPTDGRKVRLQSSTPESPIVSVIAALRLIQELPDMSLEAAFAPGRAWAFDIAFREVMVAVEYEGNTWVAGKSRHTTGEGYRRDVDKYNEAAILGWCVVRLTSDMVKDGSYMDVVLRAIEARSGKKYAHGEVAVVVAEKVEVAEKKLTFDELWARQQQEGMV